MPQGALAVEHCGRKNGCGHLYPMWVAWSSKNYKEVLPIEITAEVWGSEWTDAYVVIHCDNFGAVVVVNSNYSKVT